MAMYRIISGDSHFVEPPNMWAERVDKKFRDRAPHTEKGYQGRAGEFFVCENVVNAGFTCQSYGADKLMWSSDYPHTDSPWPHSREFIEKEIKGVPEVTMQKIVGDNAARLYGLN
ncbi:MAG: amidohydrolase family protein [Deltaproteobacteria bacterium]|nr:amidohydrolase family protein [Deltaproteobacteria bacterium]